MRGRTRIRSLMAFAVLVGSFLSVTVSVSEEASAYTPHAPILIDGNGDFTAANGVTGGSGTPSDPYVIEGWIIDMGSGSGIEVMNTNASFVIRGVYIQSAIVTNGGGIGLSSVVGGRVENVTVVRGWEALSMSFVEDVIVSQSNISLSEAGVQAQHSKGVLLDGNEFTNIAWNSAVGISDSSDIIIRDNNISSNRNSAVNVFDASNLTVDGNTMMGNGDGFYASFVSDVTFTGNRIFANNDSGAIFANCVNATIRGNNISNNGDGLFLDSVYNATLVGNSFTENDVGMYGLIDNFNSHTIPPDNLVNGKPLYYHKDCDNLTVEDIPAGELIVANCTSVLVRNLTISDTDFGIIVAFSDGVVVKNNSLLRNLVGIQIGDSTQVLVVRNRFLNNSEGVEYDFMSPNEYVLIAGNTISGNGRGIYSRFSSAWTPITGNTISMSGYGIWFDDFRSAFMDHNNFVNNAIQGLDSEGPNDHWDGGYPCGGNYWSDYAGTDQFSGPSQDEPGADGIGDTPYDVDGNSKDNYPLMHPSSDNTIPSVSITRPSDGQRVTDSLLIVNGTATDFNGTGIILVEVRVNGGLWEMATGKEDWFTGVRLTFGPNEVEARAWDRFGHSSSIARITLIYAQNTPPTASFTVLPASGNLLTIFSINASSSWDAEDQTTALKVRWDWENNGTWDTPWSNTKTAQHQYTALGTYTIRLEVRDTGGLTGNTTRSIWVNNTPPVAVIMLAPPPSGAPSSDVYVDAGRSSDLEDSVDNLSVRWDWENDSTWDTPWSTFKLDHHRYTTPGNHTICLQVRDTDGLTGSTCRTVELVDDAPPVITHTPHGDVALNEAITITANVTDDFSVKAVYLHYRFYGRYGDQSGSEAMFKMPNGTYMGIIPAQELAGTVYYSINATDFSGNEARSPSTGEYSFQAGHVENKPSADAFPLLIVSIIVIIVVIVAVAFALLMKRRKKGPKESPAEQAETVEKSGKK